MSKKKFFFLGEWWNNNGPSNVNRYLKDENDGSMYCLSFPAFSRTERIVRCILHNPIVISGWARRIELLLMCILKKDVFFLAHGYFKYENEVNNQHRSERYAKNEELGFRISKNIIAVSENYSLWLKGMLPRYADKITFVNNGINISRREKVLKEPFSIAVTGGNTRIKNNRNLCLAVESLRQQGYDCHVYVFGNVTDAGEDLASFPFAKLMGQMDMQEYYAILDRIQVMVMLSNLESFGLSVADGLNCNCSLLLSSHVGALSIFSPEEGDVVVDNQSIEEIAQKLKNLFEHPNADRMFASLDLESVSEKAAFLKMKNIVLGGTDNV